MEYREPLPENLARQETLTESMTDQLKAFEQRANAAFAVASVPQNTSGIAKCYANNISWQYLDQRFWGTVSKYEIFSRK